MIFHLIWLILSSRTSLIHYIDTYRDPNAELGGEEEELLGQARRRPWYAFWRKRGASASLSEFETPSDWLNTNMRDGLDSLEVERRRKFSGWNELVTEKENMLLKFISFFQGPILYGLPLSRALSVCLRHLLEVLTMHSHGSGCGAGLWSSRLG